MTNNGKLCLHCKQPYENHSRYILDNWDHSDPDAYGKANAKLVICNMFKLMDNLQYLEYQYEKSQTNG